ncbi:hypothetical protein MKX57_10875 [Lysinibacillus sp. FSL M8-0216]|uniref:hypothetical protein n=1 Tax=Lysinibacillus sp. FSL M8-0216 TaxID=2921619 RepID=UPI00315AFB71
MNYQEEYLFFSEKKEPLMHYLNLWTKDIKNIVALEEENYILNVGQEQYIDYLVNKLSMERFEIIENDIFADIKDEKVVNSLKQKYVKPVVYYHIPYNGNRTLFSITPNAFILNPQKAQVSKTHIIKRYIVFDEDYQKVQQDFDRFKADLSQTIEDLNKNIDSYNNSLRKTVELEFLFRKNELLRRKELVSGLTVPIRKNGSVSETFTIPDVKIKKKIDTKPVSTIDGFSPTPTLEDNTYNAILQIINDMGKEFERKPSVYSDKGEEDLRDHFLMLLEPHFDGSATGETFNKSGKTDILLRYDGGNVFVGECKFWTGAKGFLGTIDQLLGYLTWRDSKTSVIMFVRNKDFTNVIKAATESIQTHENFIKFVDQKDESWFNYIFHLNGDKNKEIKVAVMLYHIPS